MAQTSRHGLPKRTVLVLGAGASADYGYPLWHALRDQLDKFDFDQMCQQLPELEDEALEKLKSAHAEYLAFRASHSDWTLDTILHAIDVPKAKHQNPTGPWVMQLVGYVLSQIEMGEANHPHGWVTALRSALATWLVSHVDYSAPVQTNLFGWLSVISLNYDRSFQYHFCDDFFTDVLNLAEYEPTGGLPFSRALSTRCEIAIHQPHGTICNLHLEDISDLTAMRRHLRTQVQYGDENGAVSGGHTVKFKDPNLVRSRFARNSSGQRFKIFPVEDQNDFHYSSANSALRNAEQVFCLGLSPAGITQSRLQFPANGAKIYAANRASELPQIMKAKPGQWVPLVTESDGRLLAMDFPDQFARIALSAS